MHDYQERPPSPRLIRERAVLGRTGIGSGSTLRRLIRAGEFPRPVALSPGLVAWPEDEVDHWVADRIAERDRGAVSCRRAAAALKARQAEHHESKPAPRGCEGG